MKPFALLVLLLVPGLAFSHPADTSKDEKISARELAAYAGTRPTADLLQQAQNIYQLGDEGAYTSFIVGGSTVHVPSNAGYQFVPLERYSGLPNTSVMLGVLPDRSTSYVAYGNHSSNLARYFPIGLSESNGAWSITVPVLAEHLPTGARINIFLHKKGAPLDDASRLEAGQFAIAPVEVNGVDGSYQRLVQDIDSMITKLEVLSEIDYSDYFVGGSRSLTSVSDPFDQLEIGLVCLLQDPNLEGGLRSTLALIDEVPELAIALNAQIDLLAAQSAGPLQSAMSGFETLFTPFDAREIRRARVARDFPAKPNAERLLKGMLEAEVAKTRLDDPIFGPAFGAANTALGFAGLPGKIMSASIGITTAILQYRYSRTAFQNPSSAKLSATFTKTVFFQDECETTGSWTATASAKSKEWLADKAIFDLALNSVGVLGAAADTAKVANALGKADDVEDALKVSLKSVESFDRGDVGSAASDFVASEGVKKVYDEVPGSNLIRFPPKTWTGIVFDKETAQLSSNPDGLTTSGNTYVPKAVGDFKALVKVKDSLYSVGVESSDVVTISLRQASVRFSGCPDRYTPGQPYVLTATLENVADATKGSFAWSMDVGSLTSPVNNNGVSTVIWTAPDPAPDFPVTVTAVSDIKLCLPPNSPAAEGACVTQKSGNYVLEVAPQKGCYTLDDVAALTFRNLDEPNVVLDTRFELVSGVGTLTKASPNTAVFSSNNSTNATIIASLVDTPTVFRSTTLSFGCPDFSAKVIQGMPEADPWTMSFNLGEGDGITFLVPGRIEDDGETLQLEFTAATHQASVLFTQMQAEYENDLEGYNLALQSFRDGNGENPGRAPKPPQLGDVGLLFFDTAEEYLEHADDSPFNDSEFIHNDPGFDFTVSFKYRREKGAFNVPGIFESNTLIFTEQLSVTVDGGPPGAYQLDPVLTATETLVAGVATYEFFFVPKTE